MQKLFKFYLAVSLLLGLQFVTITPSYAESDNGEDPNAPAATSAGGGR